MTTGLNTLGFIQTNSLTYTEIQNDLNVFINALSEDEKLGFKTLFEGTNSQILINMLAASMSDELYHVITSRSENLLYYLNRRDSATAIAQNCSYATYRGSNVKLRLMVTPTETITLPKMSEVGVADKYSLVNVEPVELVEGVESTFDVYIGTIKSQTLTADTEDLLVFRFTNSKMSEQIALYLNNNEVPITSNIIEMLDDKYFCITNAYGGVDTIYLNKRTDFNYRYANGDNLTLKYIEYMESQLSSVDITCLYGTINAVEQLSKSIEPESVSTTRVNAPLYAETQNRIVARDDFAKVFQHSNPEIADAVGQDYSNAQVEITYVKTDGTLLSMEEYAKAYTNLSKRRGFGIPMCLLSHPNVMLGLNVTVLLQLNSGSSSTVAPYVRKVLSKQELKLGGTIDFSKLENALESYTFVNTARVVPNFEKFQPNYLAVEGTVFKPSTENGKLYVVRNPLFLTGGTEPEWPTTVGDTIEDGNLIWTCEKRGYTYQPKWVAKDPKRLQNIVWPENILDYQYRVTGYTYKTGSEEPHWNAEEGKYTTDNQIQWITVTKNLTAPAWTPDTIIEKGTIVNGTDDSIYSYQAINYIPTTSSSEPEWVTDTSLFTDGEIQYAVINQEYNIENANASNIALDWNQYVRFNETIQVV